MAKKLVLRKETLAELTSDDLALVRGGTVGYTIDTFLTQICVPLATAVADAVTQIPTRLTVVDCAG